MRSLRIGFLLALMMPAFTLRAAPRVSTYQVQDRPLQEIRRVFAQVVTHPSIQQTVNLAGGLEGFDLTPGAHVEKGQVIATLQAPALTEAMSVAHSRVRQDRTEVDINQRRLRLAQQQHSTHVATEDAVLNVRKQLSASQAQLADDQARLSALEQEIQVGAQASGQVVSVAVTDGQQVTPGQSLAVIRPDAGVWLRASFFGDVGANITPGTVGQFRPDGTDKALPVSVVSRFPDPAQPGRWQVDLTVSNPDHLGYAGRFGELSLMSAPRSYPAVPSDALILDAGSWWVMRQGGGGVEPVEVSPVAEQGGWTWIGSGLSVGDRIVVQGAYALFHRDFSRRYANPD